MRFITLDDQLYEYLEQHANPATDEVAESLAQTTRERFGRLAGMNIGADQGRFLATLVRISCAKTIVEVGTFTGMSALWMARALPEGGKLICFDVTDEYLETAYEAWNAAGVSDRIDVRIGEAAQTLAELPNEPHIDLAFIDADKPGYQTYTELLLPRLAANGVIVVDNVLWSGRIIDTDDTSDETVALRQFNDWVANHADIEAVMLPIGDGVTLITKRP